MPSDSVLYHAIAVLTATLQQQPTLAPAVAERLGRVTNFALTARQLSFDLERHPSMLGPGPDAGRFRIQQHYVFDLDVQTIRLVQEHCTGWDEDAAGLAYEHAQGFVDFAGLVLEYSARTSEAEVRAYAEEEAAGLAEALPEHTLFEPPGLTGSLKQRWEAFCAEFLREWRAAYVELVVECWRADAA